MKSPAASCLRALVFALAAALLHAHGQTAVLEAAEQPNFVWLVSEDNSRHYLQLFDEHGAPTPRIQELATEGLVFRRCFSNSPVCSVARTTLITSCYAPRIGTQFHRRSVLVPLPGDLHMFPAYLRDAGYYTTNNRKKDYNAIEGQGVWDESSPRATWRNRENGQPFFHMQSFGASHESSLHFPAEDLSERPTETDPGRVVLAPYHPDTRTFRYTYARYHDRIREIDRQIGAVVDQLEEDGLLADTFVFYFGDHGGVLPRSKGYAYESGLHIPLVVRVPENFRDRVGADVGSAVNGFVSFVDFGPTLLHLAGLPVPAEVDGRPFLGDPSMMADVALRNTAFGYADRFDEKWDLVRTVRRGRFKYMRNFQAHYPDGLQNNYRYRMLAYAEWRELFRAGQLNDVQRQFFLPKSPEALYDLEADPYETRNLAGDPHHRESLHELRSLLFDQMRAWPDLSLFPESVLVEEAFDGPVPFGRQQRERIARLLEVANLNLTTFDTAEPRLKDALSADDPWARYWALNAGSHFRELPEALESRVRDIALHDPEPLVRMAAAEYLFLATGDPVDGLVRDALAEVDTGTEAGLILNSAVMLLDGPWSHPSFDLDAGVVPAGVRDADPVQRRLQYLGDR